MSNARSMHRRRPLPWRSRASIIWALLTFLGIQLVLSLLMDHWQPELRDPEYGYKLGRLRDRIHEEPQRPLLVVLGSSRSGLAFRPEVLPRHRPGCSESPIVFNFSLTGAGPLTELICLRRLLSDGIRPSRVLVEVLPPLLYQEDDWAEEHWLGNNRLGWKDVLLLRRYFDDRWGLMRDWSEARLTACFSYRFCIMSRWAPGWLPWQCRRDGWTGMNNFGWLPYHHQTVDAEEYQRALAVARNQYQLPLQQFRITDVPDRALREILELCRKKHIAAMLILMPEGTEFQSWYPPPVRAEIEAYLAGLSRTHQVPLIDARSWSDDSAFVDSHHLLPAGAAAFTQRFDQEVLQPILEGKKPASAKRKLDMSRCQAENQVSLPPE